jgi:hypothetical protein
MYELARRIPDADHVKLEDVRFGTDLKRGGVMTLKGNVKSSDVIAEFEDSLRYDGNVVAGRYGTIDRNQRDYPYLLDTTVVVAPDMYDGGRSQGRPFRDQLRKQAAESQAEAKVEAKAEAKPESPPEAKPESPPEAKPESTLEPKPESEPESRKTEAPTSEMKKVDGQPTEATGSENS